MSRARVVFVLSMEKYHYLLLQIVLEITAVLVNNNNKEKNMQQVNGEKTVMKTVKPKPEQVRY